MDAEGFEPEEFGISESIGLAFHGFDFVVGAFQGAGRDGVVVPGQDTEGVEAERLGELLEQADAGRLRGNGVRGNGVTEVMGSGRR
jgi:hypothetical protein